MRERLIRKGLVVVIICVLLLTIPSILGQNILKEKIVRLENIRGNEEKPDLAIVNIIVHIDSLVGWHYILNILNAGNASLPNHRTKIVRLFIKPLHSQIKIRDYTYSISYSGNSHNPGEVDEYGLPDPNLLFGTYRCFFEVAPNHQWDEWNYTNNRMWAYYKFDSMDPFAEQLGDLQPWETGNEGYKSFDKEINKPFLRFLDTFTNHFPLLQQLIQVL